MTATSPKKRINQVKCFFDKPLINQKEAAQNDLESVNYYVIILFWSTINQTGYKL